MELNSIEAIKNAVQSGLGSAFVSNSAIEKELQLGVLRQVIIENVTITRILSLIYNPNRYRSKAAEIFGREILPQFATFKLTKDAQAKEIKEAPPDPELAAPAPAEVTPLK